MFNVKKDFCNMHILLYGTTNQVPKKSDLLHKEETLNNLEFKVIQN